MLSLFLGLVWALRAPLRVVLWGIPLWHGFLPPFSLSLELVFVFWHVPSGWGGLLAWSDSCLTFVQRKVQ